MSTLELLVELDGLIDEQQMEFVEEDFSSLNKARLFQGNKDLENVFKDQPSLKDHLSYLGGIGFLPNELSQEALEKAVLLKTKEFQGKSNEYAVFKALDAVVIATARTRRYFLEVDGKGTLVCFTNRAGHRNAKGKGEFFGQSCTACPHRKTEENRDGCASQIEILCYFPEIDHAAIFEAKGISYMPAADWLKQVSTLTTQYPKIPEVKAKHPHLKKVNTYFFKTRLSAGPHQKVGSGTAQELMFTKAENPYQWAELINTPATIQKCKQIFAELSPVWEALFHEPDAPPEQLTGGTPPQELKALPGAEKVTIGKDGARTTKPVRTVSNTPSVTEVLLDDVSSEPAAGSLFDSLVGDAGNTPVESF